MRDPIIATTLNGVLRSFESRIKLLERRKQYTPTVNEVDGQALLTDGTTAGAPPYSFVGDTDTGVYRDSADVLGLTVGGVSRLFLSGSALITNVQVVGGAGTAAAPTYSFLGGQGTGMFSDASNSIAWAVGGTEVMQVGANAFNFGEGATGQASIRHNAPSVAKPAYGFAGNTNTGMYRPAANEVGFSTGGTEVLRLTGGNLRMAAVDSTIYNVSWFRGNSTYGTVTLPTFSFDGDDDTGMYRQASNQIGHATAGILRTLTWSGGFRIFKSGVTDKYTTLSVDASWGRIETTQANFYFNKPIMPLYNRNYNDGTAAAPAFSFRNDSNTGMYRSAENQLAFTSGGAVTAYWTSANQANILGAYNSTTGGTSSVQVDSNGRLQRFVSARKYKTNIVPIPEERRAAFFESAEGILYNSLCETDDPDESYVGLIADEQAEAWPELVNFNPDDGSVESLKYDRIVSILVDEVKELKERIVALEGGQ